jgi:hypothetical protein
MDNKEIIERAWQAAPSWTSEAERNELCNLAREVSVNGLIVEIGGLYGGMTCVLGLANPSARIVVVDEFSWSPREDMKASPELLLHNVHAAGVNNVKVIKGDSREIGKTWTDAIELLWIDGGHSYEFVKSDLDKFGPHAQRIALHDYDNDFWPTIHRAVDDFMDANPQWELDHTVELVAVLERIQVREPQMGGM